MKFLVLLFALSACGFTPQGDLVRSTIKDKGAQAYDEGIENAEWFLCNAASVGSIRRKFGRDERMSAAYNTLCNPVVDIVTIK